MTLIVILVLFILLDVAAWRFGSDTRVSRDWARTDSDESRFSPPTAILR